LYHFDPSNPPTKAGRYANSSRKKPERQKSLSNSGKSNYRESTNSSNNSGNSDSEKSIALTNNKTPLTNPKVNVTTNNDDQTDLLPLEAPQSCDSSEDVCKTKDTEYCELKCENFKSNFIVFNLNFISLGLQLVKMK
jgi:hypothetical protein